MYQTIPKSIPNWLWTMLAIGIVVAALVLFLTDRPNDPGPALIYSIKDYERQDEEHVIYREVQRLALGFKQPTGLAVLPDGHLALTGDTTLSIVNGVGDGVRRWDLSDMPHCVAAAPTGALFVGLRDRVLKVEAGGDDVVPWAALNENAWITSAAADDHYVYVADAGNAQLLQFDHNGTLLWRVGKGEPEGRAYKFIVPSHYFEVTLDATGALWTTNPGKLGLVRFREDGGLQSEWFRPGMTVDAFAGCCNPIHIAFMSNGALVTAEKGLNRVKVFGPDQDLMGVAASHGQLGQGWYPTDDPTEPAPIRDLAVDASDRILVLHGPLRSLLIFAPKQKEESL